MLEFLEQRIETDSSLHALTTRIVVAAMKLVGSTSSAELSIQIELPIAYARGRDHGKKRTIRRRCAVVSFDSSPTRLEIGQCSY